MTIEFTGTAALLRRLRAIDNPHALLTKLQLDVTAEAKRMTIPIRRTGVLGASIAPGPFIGSTSALVVARANYAAYVEYGTGIYGPKHKPIVPLNHTFLRFPNPGMTTLGGRIRSANVGKPGAYIYARSVKGRKATPFLLPGARAALRGNKLPETIVELWNGAA